MSWHSKSPLLIDFRDPLLSDYLRSNPFNRRQSASWLESIYSFLVYQRRIHKTVPLKELHIKLGEWERQPPMGLRSGWAHLKGRNKRYFILTQCERYDYSDKLKMRKPCLEDIYEGTV
jgi:hypothetical protein